MCIVVQDERASKPWLINYASRIPAALDNLAHSRHAFDQIRLQGGPIPQAHRAWYTYFEILNSIDAQGKSGYERFPLTTYVHVITSAEADQACRANARIAPRDYQGKVGQPDPIDVFSADHPTRHHLKWMRFKGAWGAREFGSLIAGGPTGPAQKGLKWLNPFAWSETECWPDYLVY